MNNTKTIVDKAVSIMTDENIPSLEGYVKVTELYIANKDNPELILYINKFKSLLDEVIRDSERGMYIGENYHGGATREEWKATNDVVVKCKKMLESNIVG